MENANESRVGKIRIVINGEDGKREKIWSENWVYTPLQVE